MKIFFLIFLILISQLSATVSLTVGGTSYDYPETGDLNWGDDATDWAQAVTNNALFKSGGTFTLTSDVNFGTTYGLISEYYKSNSSDIADSGEIRLGKSDTICLRNNANDGNVCLNIGSDDLVQFNSIDLVDVSTTQSISNKSVVSSTISDSSLVSPTISGTTTFSAITGSRVLQTNASSELESSITTAAELAFLSGITSSVVGISDSQTLTNKIISGGTITPSTMGLKDTDLSNNLFFIWNENDTSDRVLDFFVNGGSRDINLSGDLTLEDSSILNQDLTTDASVTFGSISITSLGGDVVGTSESQILTNKTIDADNNTISNLAHGAEVDNPSSGVHGVTGSVVGTTDTQTLTNKTIDADNNTVSNLVHGSEVDDPSTGVHGVGAGDIVGTTISQSISNKSLIDNSIKFVDNIDSTKSFMFELSSITTSTNRTLTIPDKSGVIATTGDIASSLNIYSTATDYIILDADGYDLILVTDTSTDRTISLPTAADNSGRVIKIKNTSSDGGKVTVDGEGAETIDGTTTIILGFQNAYAEIACDGSSWSVLSENSKEETITYTGFTSRDATTELVKFKTQQTSTASSLLSVDNTNYTKITFETDCTFTATGSIHVASAVDVVIRLYDSSDAIKYTSYNRLGTVIGVMALTGEANAGDYIAINSGTATVTDSTNTNFSVNARKYIERN